MPMAPSIGSWSRGCSRGGRRMASGFCTSPTVSRRGASSSCAGWTPAPRVVSTLHYRQDQVGFLEDGYTHLFVVPADGGTPKALTSGKWNVGAGELRGPIAIDWTPDSKTIVFNANRA